MNQSLKFVFWNVHKKTNNIPIILQHGKENDVESFMQTVEDYLFGNGSDYERTFEEELTTGNFNGIKHTFLSSDRTTCNIVYGCYTGQGIIYLVVHSLYDSNSDADFNKIAFSMTSVSA